MDYLAMAVSAPGRALEWAMQVRLRTFSKWIFWPFGRKFQVAQKSLNRLKRAIFFQALLAQGKVDRILVSHDIHTKHRLVRRFFKNIRHPKASFSFILSFQTNITILHQINVKKCPSSIRCWDLNPRSSQHESPPITTRPWRFYSCKTLLKSGLFLIYFQCFQTSNVQQIFNRQNSFQGTTTFPPLTFPLLTFSPLRHFPSYRIS